MSQSQVSTGSRRENKKENKKPANGPGPAPRQGRDGALRLGTAGHTVAGRGKVQRQRNTPRRGPRSAFLTQPKAGRYLDTEVQLSAVGRAGLGLA